MVVTGLPSRRELLWAGVAAASWLHTASAANKHCEKKHAAGVNATAYLKHELPNGTFWNEACISFTHEDCECPPAPNRVSVWMVGVFILFYAIVVGFGVCLYKFVLRAGPTKRYIEARREGKVTETTDGDSEQSAEESINFYDFWMTASLEEVREKNGLDACLYLMHCKHMAMYCLCQLGTMGLVLIITYLAGTHDGTLEGPSHDEQVFADGAGDSTLYMFAWSFGNTRNYPNGDLNLFRFIPVLASYWCIVSTVYFTVYKQQQMDALKNQTDDEVGSSSRFTAWVSGIPLAAAEDSLVSYFEANFSESFQEVKMVWDVNLLGHNIRQRRKLITKINKLQDDLEEQDERKALKTIQTIQTFKTTVKQLEAEEPALRGKPKVSAGSCFVTFKTPAGLIEFRDTVAAKQHATQVDIGTSSWVTNTAPRPAEIYWENFGLDSGTKMNNVMKSILLTCAMFFFFVFVSCGAAYCIGFDYMYYLYALKAHSWVEDSIYEQRDAVGFGVWYGVFALGFVIVFLVLEEEMAPIVKFISKYECPLTKSIKQSSYLGKCYWFYFIYHVLLSTAILGFLALNVTTDDDDNCGRIVCNTALKVYTEAIGAFHQHRVFLTVGVIDMIHVTEGLAFFTRAGKTLTAEEEAKFTSAEDEEEAEDEDELNADEFFSEKFDFTRNYGETIGVFTSMQYYQVMHPTILWCGFCYFALKGMIDKYQICNQYSIAHVQYGRRARTTTYYILWSLTIGQFGNALYWCVLMDDSLSVGIAMAVGFVFSCLILAAYKFQPSALKAMCVPLHRLPTLHRQLARPPNSLSVSYLPTAQLAGRHTNYAGRCMLVQHGTEKARCQTRACRDQG